MKPFEPVELGENWIAVKIPVNTDWRGRWGQHGSDPTAMRIDIKHRCRNSAVVYKIQKNTHKRRGVRYRCSNCKVIAPKQVIFFIKLHNLHEKVT